ncbi:dolichol kinase [Achlya hypogyna]|uniref:dolichol kinase n=1 Tax=Achlya hypogyna TaxID=1202772 RepID=A0A1V9Z6V0_ACHHY|nr:dolichol kinase [Achlya hypogyna]
MPKVHARIVAEATIFAAAIAWLYVAAQHQRLQEALPSLHLLLGTMAALLIAGTQATLNSDRYLSALLVGRTRPEDDTGILVGVVLLPLVLCSRLLLGFATTRTIDDYTWAHLCYVIILALGAVVRILMRSPWSATSMVPESLVVAAVYWLFLSASGLNVWHIEFLLLSSNLFVHFGLLALPRSFTYGEALVLAQGLSLIVVDATLYTLQTMGWTSGDIPAHDDTTVLIQLVLISGVAMAILCTPLFQRYGTPSPKKLQAPLPLEPTAVFVGLVACVGGIFVVWSSVLLGTPLWWWLLAAITTPSALKVIVTWLLLLIVVVPLCPWIAHTLGLRQIVARKLYHFLAVALFLPASFLNMDLLRLSYAIAIGLFLVVECIRALAVPPLGTPIAKFVTAYLDHRDDGRVILSHTYLLLGCALPAWLGAPSVLLANAGVLALGIGDAMGAVVGSTIGRRKVCGKKTLEGSLAVFVSMVGFAWTAVQSHDDIATPGFLAFLWSTWLTTALEAVTCQIDNLVLPLFYLAVCSITQAYAYP